MAPPLLSVRNVSKVYRSGESEVLALNRVSLDIHKGQMVGVFGPSGSGKTTLLMIAGMIERPTSGEIFFLDRIVIGPQTAARDLTDFRRKNIGFVFQRSNLIPFLNASENVQIAMQLDDLNPHHARTRAIDLLQQLGLEKRLKSLPRQLSGGEQQRVSIARALANRPSIIFADEPTAALDSVRAKQVVDLFRKLSADEKVAIVMVTHDRRWLHIFDDVLELMDGEALPWATGVSGHDS